MWRLAVYARDGYACKKCNSKTKINAHHIENFTKKKLRFKIDNGITFCEKCHKRFHKINGVKDNTVEQLVEFLDQ